MARRQVKQRLQDSVVIDASVAIKWFSSRNESDLERAIELQNLHLSRQCLLFAPMLLIYEVSNALRFNPHFADPDLRSAIESLYDLDLTIVPPGLELALRSARVANTYGVTVYDASYLCLAEKLQTPLVTADMKFHAKTRSSKLVLTLDELFDRSFGSR